VWRAPHFLKVAELKRGDAVMTLGFSEDGQSLVTTSLDQSIRIWPVKDFSELRRPGSGDHTSPGG
jgi:WD40 repeat protein